MGCRHNFAQAWFYKNQHSKRFQCLNCGKIVNQKTFDKWYAKKLKQIQKRRKTK